MSGIHSKISRHVKKIGKYKRQKKKQSVQTMIQMVEFTPRNAEITVITVFFFK